MLVTTQRVMGYIGKAYPMTREEMPIEVRLDKGEEIAVGEQLDLNASPKRFTKDQIDAWMNGGIVSEAEVKSFEKVVLRTSSERPSLPATEKKSANASRKQGRPRKDISIKDES